jgi:hypothetical protein
MKLRARKETSMETIRWCWVLLAAVALAGCGQKWEATEFPEGGFAATFPMPVMSQPKGDGITHYWARADDVQLQVARGPVEGAGSPAGDGQLLREFYENMRTSGFAREESAPTLGQFQGRYPSMDFHMSGKAPDGQDADTKGRLILVGDHLFVASALWRTGNKKGPVDADRFLDSFKITQQ